MGNSKSQPCRSRRPLYLFYLIHRTWSVVVEHRGASRKGKDSTFDDTDRETDITSRCSGCADCGYRQESSFFDSESEMAPNAEEELLAVKPWGPQTEKQERLRPPTYNAEDYAAALRRWGRRPAPPHLETQNGTLVSTTSSSSGYASGSGEMTLRQFTSVSELLNKLRADLRLAFPSFVQEFASSPADGITLLLETLRGVQVAQNTPPSGQTGPRIGTRRAALDELGCVECLAACGERCADAPRLLIEAQPGLLALAVCLTSSLNRSRVLALQLLTRVCQAPGGHAAVSEAVSTLRLRYGEGGRFRFLAGALLAPSAAIVLRVAGVSFLNAFIKSAPRAQTKLYIQAEACEAGLEPKVLQEWLTNIDHTTVEESLTDLLRKEVNRWTRNCVDVEGLQKRASRAEETCRMLGKKILSLQNQIENLQVENMNGYNTSRDLLVNNNNNNNNNNNHNNNNKNVNHNHHHHHHHHQVLRNEKRSKKNSSNIDDEGISSSERSSTPEELKRADENDDDGGGMNNILKISSLDNDQETTIDDVIEELRIIVKDAEEEYEDKTNTSKIKNLIDNNYEDGKKKLKKTSKYSLQGSNGTTTTSCSESTKICDQTPAITYFGNRIDKEDYNNYADSSAVTRKLSSNNSSISKLSNDGSLKILVKGPDLEEAIVPAILHPQPPKRSPPCLTGILSSRNCAFTDTEEAYNSSPGDEIEEETLGDGSDSLLSASRLKYTQNEAPNTQVQLNGALLENYVTKMNDQGLIKSSKSCENLTDSKKTIRNYNSSLVMSENSVAKSYEGRQRVSNNANFEKAYSLQSSEQSHKHGGMMKYRSEIEKRKILRRTSSQDRLDEKFNGNNHQKLKRSESGIESRIRKFESLNSFENLSLQSLSRPGSVDSFNRPLLFDDNSGIKGKIMRRSESFHHISLGKKESSKRSAGGSDSGLFYVTNFDLEPVITQQIKPESLKSSNMLTKSLDRIDEGLDSMVDIILTEEKHDWKIGSEKNRSKIDKQLMKQDKEKEKRLKNGKTRIEKHVKNDKLLKNDEFYNSFAKTAAAAAAAAAAGIKHLRNDELYSDKPTLQMQKHWSYQTELDNARKSITATENALGILSISSASAAAVGSNKLKHQESFCLEKNIVGNKFSIGSNHESGIYLPGRSYDAFGLSKSRFNAGKYSGNNLSTRDNNGCNNSLIITSATATAAASGNRNSVISPTSNHGKVTDVLSGLY